VTVKWGDNEPWIVTQRGITRLAWLMVLLLVITVVVTSLATDDPCAGKTGEDFTNCQNYNYP
jgi:hypothetical protein